MRQARLQGGGALGAGAAGRPGLTCANEQVTEACPKCLDTADATRAPRRRADAGRAADVVAAGTGPVPVAARGYEEGVPRARRGGAGVVGGGGVGAVDFGDGRQDGEVVGVFVDGVVDEFEGAGGEAEQAGVGCPPASAAEVVFDDEPGPGVPDLQHPQSPVPCTHDGCQVRVVTMPATIPSPARRGCALLGSTLRASPRLQCPAPGGCGRRGRRLFRRRAECCGAHSTRRHHEPAWVGVPGLGGGWTGSWVLVGGQWLRVPTWSVSLCSVMPVAGAGQIWMRCSSTGVWTMPMLWALSRPRAWARIRQGEPV